MPKVALNLRNMLTNDGKGDEHDHHRRSRHQQVAGPPVTVITAAPANAPGIAPSRPKAGADAVPVARTPVEWTYAQRAYIVDWTALTNRPCSPIPVIRSAA